ncbi:MAG: 30S ribosomal protein S20 [Patescibacteria group bacterium]|nr:30S ribosomal protein S20 [Patescibacteria group bacterium]
MPITKSAQKALRGSLVKKAVNDRIKKNLKESVKKIQNLVKDKNKKDAKKLLPEAYKAVDKAVKRGVIKKNNASRKKSQLSKLTK